MITAVTAMSIKSYQLRHNTLIYHYLTQCRVWVKVDEVQFSDMSFLLKVETILTSYVTLTSGRCAIVNQFKRFIL